MIARPSTISPIRVLLSGNPPIAPYRYGWRITLGGPALREEKAWLHVHRYHFAGGQWWRCDANEYIRRCDRG
jgi:hypothetical protein